jgi:hypothetical protein
VGFFDDLNKVAPPPSSTPAEGEDPALQAAIDKLATGWAWETVLSEKAVEDTRAKLIQQRVRIAYKGGRFHVRHEVLYGSLSGDKPDHLQERSLDRQGLVEMLRDQPLVGKRLVEEAKAR